MRSVILGTVLLAAACGSKSSPGITSNTGGGGDGIRLAVELAPGDPEIGMEVTPTLAAAAGSQFPAVSADGKTVVDLVVDGQDFSGIPIATVTLWTKAGISSTFTLASEMAEGASPDQAELAQTTVTLINEQLAETTWHPIPRVEATGESADTGAPDTLELGDGITIKLDQIQGTFPDAGSLPEESGGGPCGEVTGLDSGYGSRELGFAVVFPRVNLGGDDCFGYPSATLGLVVPVS